MVILNSASGHTSLFLLSLTGQKSSGRTVDVYVGQVGTRDAVAVMVPFEAVMVAKVELERVCVWVLARERGRGRKLGGGC